MSNIEVFSNPKDEARMDYARGYRVQDHGTRGAVPEGYYSHWCTIEEQKYQTAKDDAVRVASHSDQTVEEALADRAAIRAQEQLVHDLGQEVLAWAALDFQQANRAERLKELADYTGFSGWEIELYDTDDGFQYTSVSRPNAAPEVATTKPSVIDRLDNNDLDPDEAYDNGAVIDITELMMPEGLSIDPAAEWQRRLDRGGAAQRFNADPNVHYDGMLSATDGFNTGIGAYVDFGAVHDDHAHGDFTPGFHFTRIS